jgi:hypothetical protein
MLVGTRVKLTRPIALASLSVIASVSGVVAARDDLLPSLVPPQWVTPGRVISLVVAISAGSCAAAILIISATGSAFALVWSFLEAIPVGVRRLRQIVSRCVAYPQRSRVTLFERGPQITAMHDLSGLRGVVCITITGFKGTGKTALLTEVPRQARGRRRTIIGPARVGALERLSDFLARVSAIHDPPSNPYETIQQFVDAYEGKRVELLIDDFPVDRSDFKRDFEYLLGELSQAKIDATIWLTAPTEPSFDAPARFEVLRVRHLSSLATEELVIRLWPERASLAGKVFEKTSGNPKAIWLLCSSATTWKRLVEEDEFVADPIVEVWHDMARIQERREILETLCCSRRVGI